MMINILEHYAIKAFKEGSDNFGETVIDTNPQLTYSKAVGGYMIVVRLRETPTHTSTSGIGFYVSGKNLDVVSGHKVFSIEITPAIQCILDTALHLKVHFSF